MQNFTIHSIKFWQGTVLYRNDLAYNYAKTSDEGNYPTGSVLYLVIWRLQEDEQWLGANIPGKVKKMNGLCFWMMILSRN